VNLRLALCVVAILVAVGALTGACGGDGKTVTLEEYFERLEAADDDADEQSQAIEDRFPNAFVEVGETQEYLDAFVDLVRDFMATLEDINAPAEAEDAHREAVAAGREYSEALEDASSQFRDVESDEELEQTTTTVFGEQSDFTAADQRFTSSCIGLQTLADENDIDIDLDCEE